jgi:hypothetical protein
MTCDNALHRRDQVDRIAAAPLSGGSLGSRFHFGRCGADRLRAECRRGSTALPLPCRSFHTGEAIAPDPAHEQSKLTVAAERLSLVDQDCSHGFRVG